MQDLTGLLSITNAMTLLRVGLHELVKPYRLPNLGFDSVPR